MIDTFISLITMVLPTETLKSLLPQDIPWWKPDYTIFFGAFYLVIIVLSVAISYVAYKTYKDLKKQDNSKH
ncbi:MAG: hypothetical protein ACRCV3_00220 [Desulfovibrionaceae bacterium]